MMVTTRLKVSSHPRRLLLILAIATHLLTLAFIVITSKLPLFDTSSHALLPIFSGNSWRYSLASSVLRWDAFHFEHIAREGYTYEHEWAFSLGSPFLMNTLGRLFHPSPNIPSEGSSNSSDTAGVLIGGLLASGSSILSVTVLYDLTLFHLRSPDAALLVSLLSLLPSSPVTLRLSGLSEPFFTLLSYLGMLHCARSQWVRAACVFALAATFRTNGILLCGFMVWGLVVEPILAHKSFSLLRTLHAIVLSVLISIPFIYHHYTAYMGFCVASSERGPWCDNFPPLIYPYVQSKYWNVGFLRYWTVQQLPNFLLGAPPLCLVFTFTSYYIRSAFIHRLRALWTHHTALPASQRRPSPTRSKPESHPPDSTSVTATSSTSPFLSPSIAPHVIHALATSLLLLFASHTQIVLRLAASMPLIYWAAAWLLVERPALGRLWVGWSVVWGAISCITWATFLPPA